MENIDQNIIKILVASDIHLGYAEKDPIRFNDSFITFEEILILANENKVDFLLLGGDLFHENKPSRPCLNRCILLLKKYCLGSENLKCSNDISLAPPACSTLELLMQNLSTDVSKENNVLQTSCLRSSNNININYLDPDLNVTLPVFSVHGNHDDPTGKHNLSAIDILASASLLNHFGQNTKNNSNNVADENNSEYNNNENNQSNLEKIIIKPLLFKKGNTKLALYGLGSIRDERLHRLFAYKKVIFARPLSQNKENSNGGTKNMDCEIVGGDDHVEIEDKMDEDYFNLFVIHQNRVKHGPTNYIPEHFLDEFLDLIIWGHEHECLIDPQWNSENSFFVSQPGSSVATSLSPGEAALKHVGLLQIRNKSFKMTKIPLKTVRPFVIKDLNLLRDAGIELAPTISCVSKKFRDKITKYLNDTMCSLIENEATALLNDHVYQPHKPLVRLRIEYDERFEFVNPIKFGQAYVDTVANPKDIIHFYKKKGGVNEGCKEDRKALQEFLAKTCPINGAGGARAGNENGDEDDAFNNSVIFSVAGVEELVCNFLQKSEGINQLSILTEKGLGLSLRQYIDKEELDSISELVKHQLFKIQQELMTKNNIDSEDVLDTEIIKDDTDESLFSYYSKQNIVFNIPENPAHIDSYVDFLNSLLNLIYLLKSLQVYDDGENGEKFKEERMVREITQQEMIDRGMMMNKSIASNASSREKSKHPILLSSNVKEAAGKQLTRDNCISLDDESDDDDIIAAESFSNSAISAGDSNKENYLQQQPTKQHHTKMAYNLNLDLVGDPKDQNFMDFDDPPSLIKQRSELVGNETITTLSKNAHNRKDSSTVVAKQIEDPKKRKNQSTIMPKRQQQRQQQLLTSNVKTSYIQNQSRLQNSTAGSSLSLFGESNTLRGNISNTIYDVDADEIVETSSLSDHFETDDERYVSNTNSKILETPPTTIRRSPRKMRQTNLYESTIMAPSRNNNTANTIIQNKPNFNYSSSQLDNFGASIHQNDTSGNKKGKKSSTTSDLKSNTNKFPPVQSSTSKKPINNPPKKSKFRC